MEVSCIHCSGRFAITAEQLGGVGNCPFCHGEIELPGGEEQQATGGGWLDESISGVVSLFFHLVLVVVLALISYGGGPDGLGNGETLFLGASSGVELTENTEDTLTESAESAEEAPEEFSAELELPTNDSFSDSSAVAELPTPTASGGGAKSFDIGQPSAGGGGGGGGGDWGAMVQQLRRNGLDIVIAFDATGSMSGEINVVKSNIRRIGTTLMKLVPKARISICTYRDEDDDYLVKGLPLSNNIQEIETYLSKTFASGGGDLPEAVQEGLRWSVEKNEFRSRAKKVVLLFGDAPPHSRDLKECLELASDFQSQNRGIVSTVTCRSETRLLEFVEIAQAGGGEAFLTSDVKQIMTQLLILVFGSEYRDEVLDKFGLE